MEGEKMKEKSFPLPLFFPSLFFTRSAGSKTAGPRKPRAPCPRTICRGPGSCQDGPPRSRVRQRPCLSPPPHTHTHTQHPAPSGRRKQPVRGDLCVRKGKDRKALASLCCISTSRAHTHTGGWRGGRRERGGHLICHGNRYLEILN